MQDAEELAEMRALQARAYGRDGNLSDADAARLSELQARVGARPVEVGVAESVEVSGGGPSIGSGPQGGEVGGGVSSRFARSTTEGQGEAGEGVSSRFARSTTEGRGEGSRRRGRILALAAAGLLVVGIGIGWLLFNPSRVEAVALTSEQQEWQRALLAEAVYDSGSVRAIAVEEGVVIWVATKDEGQFTCLILSDGEATSPSCQRTEVVAEAGIQGSILVEAIADSRREVSAQVLFSATGEPAVAVNSYEYVPGSTGIVYANEEETRTAEKLADEGFDPHSIWVVGYDGDVPIWTAMKLDEPGSCLIYDGSTSESPRVCADPQTMVDQESGLVLNVANTTTGSMIRIEMPANGPGYLTITRDGGGLGDSMELGGEHGDPIEVTVPSEP